MNKVRDPSIVYGQTIYQEMPKEVVEVLRKHNLKIKLDKVVLSRLFDQMPGMVSTDGCWSSPSGPGC